MMLRNVTSRTVKPFKGSRTGLYTEFTLDCGHRTSRNGELLAVQRLLCASCAAAVGEKTARALAGRASRD